MGSGFRHMSDVQQLSVSVWRIAAGLSRDLSGALSKGAYSVWGLGQMMTLRQVEVIRAVMVTGTIGGAAKLLNVSAPGISRLVKYTERSLGIRFFQRQNGRYFPTPEAQNIFEQINGVYKKVYPPCRFCSEACRQWSYRERRLADGVGGGQISGAMGRRTGGPNSHAKIPVFSKQKTHFGGLKLQDWARG